MDKDLTAEDVGALKLSKNGKSLGIDGIPYEFYIRQVPLYLPKTAENNLNCGSEFCCQKYLERARSEKSLAQWLWVLNTELNNHSVDSEVQ